MEADLARYYDVDLRDLWRRDTEGRPRLSWRRLRSLVRFLPPESAVAWIARGRTPWRLEHLLLADLFLALTGKQHPLAAAEVKAQRLEQLEAPERLDRVAEARRRAQERRAAIERGEIT